jgi:hypothetical protein
LCVKHPAILAGNGEKSSFATTAIFSRFPNKNPENAIFEFLKEAPLLRWNNSTVVAAANYSPGVDDAISTHLQWRYRFGLLPGHLALNLADQGRLMQIASVHGFPKVTVTSGVAAPFLR